jgi:hypothetical protein
MAGDTIDVGAKSYYVSQMGTGTNSSFTDVLNSLAGGIMTMTTGGKGTSAQLSANGTPLYSALTSFITNKCFRAVRQTQGLLQLDTAG